jgi:serine phosphatase RsbU (regulator of sigma subunit)
MGRGRSLVGVLVLGSRLSEEPYSREDKRLLASVARQAAIAVENIRLAEEIAERLEAERRASVEIEVAKNVQDRLLPVAPTHLRTLECAARCIQAKSVGGDYYDFLDLGHGRLGLVLADVSGKGIHAALLMANLQAHIRSQSGISPDRPAQMLKEVNDLLWKSTAPEHFATLFYGIYDDHNRRLSYVNCGHNPPIVVHLGRSVKRLRATATVIGAFEKWRCTVGHLRFDPGDLLIVFSDGITEAARENEQFGDERLIDLLLASGNLSVEGIAEAVLSSVQEFSAGQRSDDLTLIVARVRGTRHGEA